MLLCHRAVWREDGDGENGDCCCITETGRADSAPDTVICVCCRFQCTWKQFFMGVCELVFVPERTRKWQNGIRKWECLCVCMTSAMDFPCLFKNACAKCLSINIQTFLYQSYCDSGWIQGTNPALKKPSNIPEIYAKMFGRIHWSRL